jgi:hypothetical protein
MTEGKLTTILGMNGKRVETTEENPLILEYDLLKPGEISQIKQGDEVYFSTLLLNRFYPDKSIGEENFSLEDNGRYVVTSVDEVTVRALFDSLGLMHPLEGINIISSGNPLDISRKDVVSIGEFNSATKGLDVNSYLDQEITSFSLWGHKGLYVPAEMFYVKK